MTTIQFGNKLVSSEIGAVVVEFLEYRDNDGLLVVATHGNGIYQTNLNFNWGCIIY